LKQQTQNRGHGQLSRIIMFETSSLINMAKGLLESKCDMQDLAKRLERLVSEGKIAVVCTHLQIDEIKHEDEKRIVKDLFERLRVELIPTKVAVYEVSKYDVSRYGSELENQLYKKLRTDNSKEGWTKDLIQALTSVEVDILVTDDSGVRHAIEQVGRQFGEQMRCEAYGLDRFAEMLEGLIQ